MTGDARNGVNGDGGDDDDDDYSGGAANGAKEVLPLRWIPKFLPLRQILLWHRVILGILTSTSSELCILLA